MNNTIGVITGNSSENVKAFLVEHGLDGYVRAIYGVDVPGSKVEKISQARSQFATIGEVVFMVGDSASDVRAAREAGVKSIAVTWGHQSAETLLRANPDFLVGLPNELHKVINETVSLKKEKTCETNFP